MAVTTSALRPALPNRRRRVRHKVQTPAYASFTAQSRGPMLDLHEILNISEDGVAVQCGSRLEAGRSLHVCLDLAESAGPVHTMSRVVWSDATARAGLCFSELPPASLLRLREWLFLNVMTGAANREEIAPTAPVAETPPLPSYSDTLAALTAVQRQVEALGPDLSGALRLVADRAQNFLRASGAAIALATDVADVMECRASSGTDAPPVGARLQVGSGFSGECVKSGTLQRCNDSELDARVDRESCRALGIRSMLAVPLRLGEKPVGILEAFSPQPNSFAESDGRVMQRLAETILAAVNRAARSENLTPETAAEPFTPKPGSVLFASAPQQNGNRPPASLEQKSSSGFSVLRSHLIILILAACVVFLALGYLSAQWLQTDVAPWLQGRIHARAHTQLETVLASSSALPRPQETPTVEIATLEQLKQLAKDVNVQQQTPQILLLLGFEWTSRVRSHRLLLVRKGHVGWRQRGSGYQPWGCSRSSVGHASAGGRTRRSHTGLPLPRRSNRRAGGESGRSRHRLSSAQGSRGGISLRVGYDLRSGKLFGGDGDHSTVYPLPAAEGDCRNHRRGHALIYKVKAIYG